MEQTIASIGSSALIIPAFIFGSVVGSFLNVCIYRLPRRESIIFTHSHCTSCGAPIKLYDIIPIASYLILFGRCRACGSRISPTYLVVELLSGVVSALLVLRFGISLTSLFYLIFLFSLIVVTFIDLEHRIIPNVITLPGIIVGLIYNALNTNWVTLQMELSYFQFTLSDFLRISDKVDIIGSILGIILGGGILYFIGFIYEAIKKREGMGMGDVKLLAMIGAFIGWKGVIFVAFLSSLFGVLVGIPIIFFKKGDLKYAIPYGPFLSLAAALYCFTGGFSFRF
ncbi:MAG TPA: prepilin peptidase [Thermodesulfobacteriota bacterium]|nr:prepilin peptidase [Thermodesulfobacteriota bacterium]